MRYIDQAAQPKKQPKEKPVRNMPTVGKYSSKDLQAKGVKSGVWEKKDV